MVIKHRSDLKGDANDKIIAVSQQWVRTFWGGRGGRWWKGDHDHVELCRKVLWASRNYEVASYMTNTWWPAIRSPGRNNSGFIKCESSFKSCVSNPVFLGAGPGDALLHVLDVSLIHMNGSNLNQVWCSRGTSKTCRAGGSRAQCLIRYKMFRVKFIQVKCICLAHFIRR